MFDQLREDIACIHQRDPAARSRIEILTCYPGLHAILVHRLAHALWRRGWYWAGRFTSHLGRLLTGIEIHPGARIGRRVFIDHGFGVVIGETAEIGDDCTIYQGVTLGGTRLYKGEKRHPTLEEGVVVGAGAQILGGFTVGAHARIGSNAVVIKPVPAGATAVGNPARVILPKDHAAATTATSSEPVPTAASPDRDTVPSEAAPTAPRAAASPCQDESPMPQSEWAARPLQELLQRGRAEPPAADGTSSPEDFAPYGIGRTDDDPLVQVLHELINHTAQQDARIQRLCAALEDLGQRIDNGQHPLDAERLNRMVE
ncbi:MAG: serine O-acetyltransferase [Castellaniella sp.]|uniref:serine O-acetyltransferase n=1 Tax=Castellaniella sp. TaxID=1955812 RepID=UPI002A364B8B|nr:serine O-acetyltransferase [Castellaniella sp.]MDY0310105.1 serine O-acetyltransferase [Castellaniella sp.]